MLRVRGIASLARVAALSNGIWTAVPGLRVHRCHHCGSFPISVPVWAPHGSSSEVLGHRARRSLQPAVRIARGLSSHCPLPRNSLRDKGVSIGSLQPECSSYDTQQLSTGSTRHRHHNASSVLVSRSNLAQSAVQGHEVLRNRNSVTAWLGKRTLATTSSDSSTAWDAGRSIEFTQSQLALRAGGAAEAAYGNTRVLAAVTTSSNPQWGEVERPKVEYVERAQAVGMIEQFNTNRSDLRERRVTRMIEFALKPSLLPDVGSASISCMPLSSDGSVDPDVLALNAASLALSLSGLPTTGLVGAVRVGFVNGTPVLNPAVNLPSANILYAGTREGATLVEYKPGYDGLSPTYLSTDELCKTLERAHSAVLDVIEAQEAVLATRPSNAPEFVGDGLEEALLVRARGIVTGLLMEQERAENSHQLSVSAIAEYADETLKIHFAHMDSHRISRAVDVAIADYRRASICEQSTRCDGRSHAELRPITAKAKALQQIGGSAIVAFGDTVSTSSTARGGRSLRPTIEPWSARLHSVSPSAYALRLTEPAFAGGDIRGGRVSTVLEEAFAENALATMVSPAYPGAIKTTTQVTSSNGAAWAAAVCSGSLSVLDLGAPASEAIAAVTCGLVTPPTSSDETTAEVFLIDPTADEEDCVDMLVHVAGTGSVTSACYGVATRAVAPNRVCEMIRLSTQCLPSVALALEPEASAAIDRNAEVADPAQTDERPLAKEERTTKSSAGRKCALCRRAVQESKNKRKYDRGWWCTNCRDNFRRVYTDDTCYLRFPTQESCASVLSQIQLRSENCHSVLEDGITVQVSVEDADAVCVLHASLYPQSEFEVERLNSRAVCVSSRALANDSTIGKYLLDVKERGDVLFLHFHDAEKAAEGIKFIGKEKASLRSVVNQLKKLLSELQ